LMSVVFINDSTRVHDDGSRLSLSTEPKATPLRNAPTVSPSTVSSQMSQSQAPCKVLLHKHTRWGDHRAEKHPNPSVPPYTVQKKTRRCIVCTSTLARCVWGASVRDRPLPSLYPLGHSHTRTLRSLTPFFATNYLPLWGMPISPTEPVCLSRESHRTRNKNKQTSLAALSRVRAYPLDVNNWVMNIRACVQTL